MTVPYSKMKRKGYIIEQVADMENLRWSYIKAKRGKSAKQEVLTYSQNLQENLMSLRSSLLTDQVQVGNYHYFTIYDPKERLICAAPFAQRVLHHALMNICHEDFERFQTNDSYASRIGRGTYMALEQAIHNQNTYRYCLKLDVRKYFDSVDHSILLQQLQRIYKDPHLLLLFSQIIDSYSVSSNKGLPIGNLTSQYFANHYLAYADHYIREHLHACAYIRYMDDMLIWDNDRARLLKIGIALREYLALQLQLSLKVFTLAHTSQFITFLGYRIAKHEQRLSKRSADRFREKLKYLYTQYNNDQIDQTQLQHHLLPLLAFVNKVQSDTFRQQTMMIIQ